MSNLSDLLPAGAGAKVITATASGNLATGQTVILQSDGTVKAVSAITESLGSETAYESANTQWVATTFDSSNNKVVVAYRDAANSGYATAAVGTVSGTSLSFGTPVVFNSNDTNTIGATFDSSNNKVVLAFRNSSYYPMAIVGTVSGTSISFGSATEVQNISAQTSGISLAFDTDINKVIYVYCYGSNTYVKVGAVSGTSISFGSVSSQSFEALELFAVFDTSNNKTVISFRDASNSNYGSAAVIYTSGGNAAFIGSATVFESATARPGALTFDSSNNKVVIPYTDSGDSSKGKAVVGTVSGNSISFGSAVTFETGSTATSDHMGATFDSNTNTVVVVYEDADNSNAGTYVTGTVSGTSISFNTPVVYNAGGSEYNRATFDSSQNIVVIAYSDDGNSGYGTAIALRTASTNSSDFVGITNQAINNSASGEVVVEGGVITNGSLLPNQAYSGSRLALSRCLTHTKYLVNSDPTYESYICYDTSNDKVVIAYHDTTMLVV